jgi:hypothetical protein
MGHKWIINVLADLNIFAEQNDLPLLAAQLEKTSIVAAAEIGSLQHVASQQMQGEQAGIRRLPTEVGTGPSA